MLNFLKRTWVRNESDAMESRFRPTSFCVAGMLFWVGCFVGEPAAAQDESAFSDQDIEFFERSVRPILVERCFDCHGPDSGFEGGLSLASRADVVLGGDSGSAIDLEEANESLLVQAINYEVYEMPPDSRLPQNEVDILQEWVKRGAPWTPGEAEGGVRPDSDFDIEARRDAHWCWQPIQQVVAPPVNDADWPLNEVDRFILHRLEAAGLSPNPSANKQTWLRRVHFDLVGLPPTPDELAAFLADDSTQAYERVVDRLLQSERFGERWGRHWLDLVRFAETCGHEFDYPIPHAYQYRDYVIRAFNQDVSYDQFVMEHLAGDLLAEPRRNPEQGFNESLIGTGFWFLGEATHAPVDVRGDEAGRIDNQLDVMSKTFMAMTVACARCHDHKFDAISTKDYYAFSGFLQSSRRQEAMLDRDGRIEQGRAELQRIADAGLSRFQEYLRGMAEEPSTFSAEFWQAALHESQTAADANDSEQESETRLLLSDAWKPALAAEATAGHEHPAHALHRISRGLSEGRPLPEIVAELNADTARILEQRQQEPGKQVLFFDGSSASKQGWYFSGAAYDDPHTFVATSSPADFESKERINADAEPVVNWTPSDSGGFLSTDQGIDSGQLSDRLFGVARSPTFEHRYPRIHYRLRSHKAQVRLIIDGYTMDIYNGLLFGGANRNNINTEGKWTWVTQAGDIGRYLGHRAHLEVIDHGDGVAAVEEIWFSHGGPPPAKPSLLAQRLLAATDVNSVEQLISEHLRATIAAVTQTADSPEGTEECDVRLLSWLLENGLLPNAADLLNDLRDFSSQAKEVSSRLPTPMFVQAIQDGSGEDEFVFVRGNHRVLGEVARRQPLTVLSEAWTPVESGSGRLAWAQHLVSPEHPLTSRVIVNRIWAHLFGVGIVPSVDNFGVLGQTPSHPELLDHLAIEFTGTHSWSVKSMIRQLVLSQTYRMSSHLQEAGAEVDPENQLLHRMRIRRLEGEAIRDSMVMLGGNLNLAMYGNSVPVHLTAYMQGRGRPGRNGPVDGGHRRSIYQEIRRNFLPPMLIAFDTPIPFSTMGRRNISNVPAQALILLNDPSVHQFAGEWATRVLALPELSDRDRIVRLYVEAFSRQPSEQEVGNALSFLSRQAGTYGGASQGNFDSRAWHDLAHVLFNVKEFIYLN